jgi:RHS repeat-associated protein
VWESNSPPTYSSSPPGASTAYVLLSEYTYDPATGRQDTATGPGGAETAVFYDNLGRRTAVAENWVDYDPSTSTTAGGGTNNVEDRVTKWAYNGASQVVTLTAVNVTPSSGTVDEITEYQYTNSYDATLVTLTKYPDGSTSGVDNVQMTYNLDGSIDTRVDQRGIKLTYVYEDSRRLIREEASVTSGTFASKGVDDSILSIGRTYDSLGRVETIGSNSAADGTGTVENEIKYTYHSTLGYLEKSEQSHQGAVSGSLAVQYAHDDSATASHIFTNGLRLETVTYPKTSRVIYFGYGAADSLDDRLSREQEIRETNSSGTQLTAYSYNGTSRLVVSDYPQPDVKLDLAGSTAGTYAGFDRFGRTVSQKWTKSSTAIDQFDYTYDYAGDRLTRDVPSSLYSADDHDQVYTYDGLHRLGGYQQGTQSGSSIVGSSLDRQQDWTLDQLGNWAGFFDGVYDGGEEVETTSQTRTHNGANEITAFTTSGWIDPSHDAAGNMTEIPQPTDPTLSSYLLSYDAWNRLVEVKDGTSTVLKMRYDGLGRRIARIAIVPGGGRGGGTIDVPTDYYYNEQWQLLEERYNGDVDPRAQYVWHPYYIDALAVRYWDSDTDGSYGGTNEGAQYYCQDANYNVTAVTNSLGTVLERYNYTPYGEVTFLDQIFAPLSTQASAIGNTHLYTGRERDPETGLQLNRHRYYASHLGRWLTRDPIGYGEGANLYLYVHTRPTTSVDANGLDSMIIAAACHQLPPVPPTPPMPPCPQKNPGGSKGDGWCSEGQNHLHPGSKECFRQVLSSPGPGNQCCYDSNGDLISSGPGAGTPDRVDPAIGEDSCDNCRWNLGGVAGHIVWDVLPFGACKLMHYTGAPGF